jgi:aerotaxis receptor
MLLSELNKLGFESYDDFMIHAAIEELKSQEESVSESGEEDDSNLNLTVKKISHIRFLTATSLNGSFSRIGQLQTSSSLLSDKITMLSSEFKKLKFLSVNMDAMATKFGENAATLAVISLEFSKIASQIEVQMNSFAEFAEKLLDVIKTCSLNLAALKTQMNMVNFFVKESIAKNGFDEMVKNQDMFTGLFSLSTVDLLKELSQVKKELNTISGQILEVKKFINGLEIIKQTGAIESSRHDQLKAAFVVYLDEMNSFIKLLRDSTVELNSQKDKILANAIEVESSTSEIKDNINQLFKLALVQ